LARILGTFYRTGAREVTFMRVVPTSTPKRQIRAAEKKLRAVADDVFRIGAAVEVVVTDSPVEAVAEFADRHDLVVLGVEGKPGSRRLFGGFTAQLAQLSQTPLMIISHQR
jgi:nucleotide-binding universal stress UspA family protein